MSKLVTNISVVFFLRSCVSSITITRTRLSQQVIYTKLAKFTNRSFFKNLVIQVFVH